MVTYKEIYNKVVSELCKEAELSVDDLPTSKEERCVELRKSLVHCISEYGLKEKEIVETTGFSQPMVNRYINMKNNGYMETFTMTVFRRMILRIIQREIDNHLSRIKNTSET